MSDIYGIHTSFNVTIFFKFNIFYFFVFLKFCFSLKKLGQPSTTLAVLLGHAGLRPCQPGHGHVKFPWPTRYCLAMAGWIISWLSPFYLPTHDIMKSNLSKCLRPIKWIFCTSYLYLNGRHNRWLTCPTIHCLYIHGIHGIQPFHPSIKPIVHIFHQRVTI